MVSLIAIAVGKAVVRKFDASMLSENDGPLFLTTNWAKSLLYRMNFVKRKVCSTEKPTVHGYETIKTDFFVICWQLSRWKVYVPVELVFNWDHTPINIVPWPKRQKELS